MAATSTEKITLEKKGSGLGFTIQGGIDVPYALNDPGIFVTLVKPNGAAARDGRIKPGDKILELDGHDLRSVLHERAVHLFHHSGDPVELLVERRGGYRIRGSDVNSSIGFEFHMDSSMTESELPLTVGVSRRIRKRYLVPAILILLLGIPAGYFIYRRLR